MGDDAAALPSFLLAEHHIGQRDHHNNIHGHRHHHIHLHKRQIADTIVQVVTTVAVVQEIDVDSNGNILSTELLPVASDPLLTPPLTTTTPTSTTTSVSVPTTESLPPSTSTSSTSISSSSTDISATPSSPSSTITSTSTLSPLIPTSSLFATLPVNSNSSSLIQSSNTSDSSQSHFSNSSATLVSSSSVSSQVSLKSHTEAGSLTGTASLSTETYAPSSTTASGADGPLIGGSGTAVASGTESSSTAGSGSGSSSNSSSTAPPTPVIIGSVVSGVAGAAFLILVLLWIWRWKKRGATMLPLGNGPIGEGPSAPSQALRDAPPPPAPMPSGSNMVERRSFAYAFPAALAGLTGYKRFSQRTETETIFSAAGSERGFYRVSGRKLPSVLQTGGDGYGDGTNDGINNRDTFSGSSFYRDSQGFYGGPGSPALQNPTQRDSGVPVMRPSPARTPVTEQGFFTAPPKLNPPPIRPDFVGRSHSSQDGSRISHTSKFTEEV